MLSPKKKWRGCQQLEGSWLQSFWKRNFRPRGTTVNSSHHSETLKHLNTSLHQVSTIRNPNCCSSISYRSHTIVHNTEAITEFGWIVLLYLPYSLEFAWSDYICFHPCKKRPAKEGKQLFLGRNTYCCWKVEEECQQTWKPHWKVSKPSATFL